jgi:uncharacterized protein (DUF305 family)
MARLHAPGPVNVPAGDEGISLPCAAVRLRHMPRPGLLFALALAALAAGCGGDGGDNGDPAGLGDIRANGTDVAFVNATIPHHEQAVDVADLALARAEHRPLERLAQEIIQTQSVELTTLRSVRDVLQDAGVEEGDLGLSEEETGIHHDPTALRNATDFDCEFLELMIPHHQGAIRMARAELESGIHAELRRMSEDVIDTQGFELRQMRRYQRRWCGSA